VGGQSERAGLGRRRERNLAEREKWNRTHQKLPEFRGAGLAERDPEVMMRGPRQGKRGITGISNGEAGQKNLGKKQGHVV